MNEELKKGEKERNGKEIEMKAGSKGAVNK